MITAKETTKKKKIEITQKQVAQFNQMYFALREISKDYMTPDEMRRKSERDFGLDFEECLEMSYENIQYMAKSLLQTLKIKPLKL